MPRSSVDTITQNVYEEMASITLLSIPLSILKGAAIGRSRAGQDLTGPCTPGCSDIPGGLGIATCSPARCSPPWRGPCRTCPAIGSAGIPKCASAAYSRAFASGTIAAGGTLGILVPPSITMILYAVASEQSLGRLFLAAIGPALLLVVLFAIYAMWQFRWECGGPRPPTRVRHPFRDVARRHPIDARQIRTAAARPAVCGVC